MFNKILFEANKPNPPFNHIFLKFFFKFFNYGNRFSEKSLPSIYLQSVVKL